MPKCSFAITFFMLLFFCGATHAQVRLGVEAGPDFPRVLDFLQGYSAGGSRSYQNTQSATRLYGGFFADIPLDRKDQFIFRATLRYLGAGGETPQIVDFNGNQIAAKTNYAFNYIDLPLQLLYSPSLSFGKPWIGGGFYPAVLLNATAKSNQGSQSLTIGSASGDDIKRFDFGFNATAGFTLKCGALLGVDFQQGLQSIAPVSYYGGSVPKVRNTIWGVHLGYTWNLNGKPHPKT